MNKCPSPPFCLPLSPTSGVRRVKGGEVAKCFATFFRRLDLACVVGLAVLAIMPSALGQSTSLVLTNARDILALPADKAYGTNVLIRGVVTAAQPDAEWSGRFFVQDATAGVFVENIGTNQPKPGDFIEVAGVSHPGGFAPIITFPR